MLQRTGRCTNYSNCKLAYRREEIKAVSKAFLCPECGLYLEPVRKGQSKSVIFGTSIALAVLLLLTTTVIFFALASSQNRRVVLGDPSPSPALLPVASPSPAVVPE